MVERTQTIRRLLPTNCLSVFDHFVWLALKDLSMRRFALSALIFFHCFISLLIAFHFMERSKFHFQGLNIRHLLTV